MNERFRWWQRLPFYAPEPGGGDPPPGDPPPGDPPPGDPPPGDPPPDPYKGTQFEGKKVPDKFVGEKDGKKVVKVDAILESYIELERSQNRRREEVLAEARTEFETARKAAAPAAPGDYTVGAKTKFGEREGFAIKIGERDVEVFQADPALNYMKGIAHKYGMPQAEFSEMVQGYIQTVMASGPKWVDEAKALGGDAIADKRHQRVDGFLKSNLSDENYAYFVGLPATAKSIAAIEQLMTLSGHPPFVPDAGDIPGNSYTAVQLKEMQRDPRYTGENRPGGADKEFVKLVRAGYTKLAKGK